VRVLAWATSNKRCSSTKRCSSVRTQERGRDLFLDVAAAGFFLL